MRNARIIDAAGRVASLRRHASAMLVACAVIALPASLLDPAPAAGQTHAGDPLNEYWGAALPTGNGCSSCHTLNDSEGEPNTAYIISSSRTHPDMKAANGGTSPAGKFGCTYCHNRTTFSAKMKGVLTHFSGQRSQHPIGRKFTGASAYTDTQGEYLSSITTDTPEEMDCLDCHDEDLVNPGWDVGGGSKSMQHIIPIPATNPYMLKYVTAAGQYDNLCRSCHGTDTGVPTDWKGKGKDIRVISHKDGRDAANALAEIDGTLLLTSDPDKSGTADTSLTNQCAGCHSVHGSPNSKLFTSAFGNGTDCTACHLKGDRYDNYIKHSHGKTIPDSLSTYEYGGVRLDLAMPCTDCHVALDVSTTNLAGTRKKHNEKLEIDGSRETYKKNFNLSKNVNSADPGTATGNPEWGICIACHALTTYKAHVSFEGARRGCQDCHDEHAEGSGSTSNVFMISETSKGRGYFKPPTITPAGTETVIYAKPRFLQDHVTVAAGPFDFYRADGNGACDNTDCHGASNTPTTPGPLSQLMGTSSADTKHSGGYVPPGNDCESCHSHKDPQGGWGASKYCDNCHFTAIFPNLTGIARTHADSIESQKYHALHAFSPLIGGCADCHIHNGKTVGPNTGTHADGTVNFGGPLLTTALDYSASGFATPDCTNANGCHNAGNNEWKNGLGANACADCHAATGKTLDQGGYPAPNKSSATKHTKHIDNTAYVAGGCNDCHGANASAGGQVGHKDGAVTLAATAKLTSYAKATRTCDTSCHLANTTNDWTDAVTLACEDCHAAAGKTLDQGGYPVPNRSSATKHTRHINNAAYVTGGCNDCHGANASTGGQAGHKNGSATLGATAKLTSYAKVTRTCDTSCHLADTANDWTDAVALACEDCHAGSYIGGGANLPQTGLHATSSVSMTSGVVHDNLFKSTRAEADPGTATCAACHTTTPSTNHIDGALTTSWAAAAPSISFAANVGFTDGTPPNCSPNNTLVNCHDDKGAWQRWWSSTADDNTDAVCDNCHGAFKTGTDSWVTGISPRHNSAGDPGGQIEASHDNGSGACYQCHAFGTASAYYSPTTSWTNHRDGSIQLNNQNYFVDEGANGQVHCDGCHTTPYGTADGQFAFRDTLTGSGGDSRWGRTMIPGPAINCSNCHGTNGTNIFPDGGAQNGAGYENRGGAHQRHVAAIAARNAGVIASDASSCNWCHPGGAHSGDHTTPQADLMNGVTSKFRSITGGTDSDGAFVAGTSTCANIDCHAGTTTPGWYSAGDAAAPAWTPNSGIAASNPSLGGILNVTWNAAVDAYPSNPVTYDLFRATTGSAAAVFAGPPIATNLLSTSATVTDLVVDTPYYFGVRAKDSWITRNVTANTDISTVMTPRANPWVPGSKTYYLTRSSGIDLWTPPTTSTNLPVCGTPTTGLAVVSAPLWTTMPGPNTPPAGRGRLTLQSAGYACGASTNNYMESGASTWPNQWRNFAGFYSEPYPGQTLVQGAPSTFGFQGYYNYLECTDGYSTWACPETENVLAVFAAVDSGGNTVATSANSVISDTLSNTMAGYTLNLSTLSVTVPQGGRLAVLFYFYDHPNSGATTHRIAYDNYGAGITNTLAVIETLQDSSPPTWTGAVSGITVQDAGTGGTLNVFWNNATDLPAGAPAPPVLYDLYRVQSASCTNLWNNRYQNSLGSTSFQDTGLIEGAAYCYGVRAKDSWVPPNVTGNTDTATGIPSLGTAFGCTGCHASPPITGNNAGSHAAHANSDADYTDCNNCHPGTTSYANGHQDGKGQLAFDGTAATAVYNGNQVSYTDNALTIYNDASGYGILTGSAGDGIDNGTCAGTPANYCHGAATPTWGNAATAACSSCHSGGGGTLAPVVTSTSTHVDADGAGTAYSAGTCTDCHAGHFQGVQIPLPPESWSNPNLSTTNMRTRLGIAYGNTGGIDLGGPGTVASIASKTTEADICWGCHDVGGESEWGYNTKTTPAGYPNTIFANADGNAESENHGWIYTSASYATKTSDWTQGYWMSPYDPLLKRRMASIHTASLDPTGQSSSVATNVKADGTVERTSPFLEFKGKIRCSYCHDVHNTFGPNGKPYLRGTWVGDPYPPELPPRTSYTYNTGVSVRDGSKTPRGLVTARDKGGYFIDQNSGWPTKVAAMDTLAETAGLCTLCHGTSVDTMDYYPGSKLWLAGMTNGHSNSCLGGTGANKKDLFTASRYGCGMGMQGCVGSMGAECNGNYPQSNCGGGPCGSGSGCAYVVNSGWYWGSAGGNPVDTFGGSGGGDYANWYGVGTIGSADVSETAPKLAHKFTCSKCHSPHASGLPALLTQNCIDPSLGSTPFGGANLIANNCHRKTSRGNGWHYLAPGQ